MFSTRYLLLIFVFSILLYAGSPFRVFAQSTQSTSGNSEASLGVARMISTTEKNVKDGNILSAGEKSAVLSSVAYDPHVVGVVSRDAAIVLDSTSDKNAVPVISTGTVYVLVATKDGKIQKGDLLTTTPDIPGVAVKATKEGYVIGRALEDYDNPDGKKVDKIAADLDLHYFNSKPTFAGTLSDILKLAVLPTKDGPQPIFKYIVAAAVVLGSLVLGFMSFGRTAAKGVEALGRNPAASKIIHLGIIFNVGIVVMIGLVGLTIAFLILRL